jgi:tRNA dimethylallyltransferase
MAARLMPTDGQRIVRALEVLECTGRSLAHWQRTPGTPVLDEGNTRRLLVLPDRAAQGAAIDARLDAMMAAGALDEVRALVALGLSDDLPVMRALGVAPLAAHLAGAMRREAAAASAKADTRQYAKRQLTWLRRNMTAWKAVLTQEMERITADTLPFIDA